MTDDAVESCIYTAERREFPEEGSSVFQSRRDAIEVRGLVPEAAVVRFRPARHNAVSRVETVLRRSFVRRLVFHTPLFRLCLAGAKLYYRLWTAAVAPRLWRRVLEHPVYGPGWRGRLPRALRRGGRA